MSFVAHLIFCAAVLPAGLEGSALEAQGSPAIALLFPSRPKDSDCEMACLVPVALFEGGKWTREKLDAPIEKPASRDSLSSTIKAPEYAPQLKNQVFRWAHDPGKKVTLSESDTFCLILTPYFALTGPMPADMFPKPIEGDPVGPKPLVMLNQDRKVPPPETIENPDSAAGIRTETLFKLMEKAMEKPEREIVYPVKKMPEPFMNSLRGLPGKEKALRTVMKLSEMSCINRRALKKHLEADGFSKEDMDAWEAWLMSGGLPEKASPKRNKSITRHIAKYLSDVEQQYYEAGQPETPVSNFKPELYGSPRIETLIRLDMGSGRKGLWCHIRRTYPKEIQPQDNFWGDQLWQENYYALLQEGEANGYRALWESPQIVARDNVYSYGLMGVCEADGDGWAEIILEESAHEHCAYQLLTVSKGKKYQVACAMNGSL